MSATKPSPPLPLGAHAIEVDLTVESDELAMRLMEAGASDLAIDAAGGSGAAKRLRAGSESKPETRPWWRRRGATRA